MSFRKKQFSSFTNYLICGINSKYKISFEQYRVPGKIQSNNHYTVTDTALKRKNKQKKDKNCAQSFETCSVSMVTYVYL